MAKKPTDLTVDYKKLLSMPLQDRARYASSSLGQRLYEEMTPGQRAAAFPSYYRKQVESNIQAVSGGTSGFTSAGGGGGNGGGGTAETSSPGKQKQAASTQESSESQSNWLKQFNAQYNEKYGKTEDKKEKTEYSSPNKKIDRSQFADQLKDPETMRMFAGRMKTEVGSQGREAQIAWAETTFNRASSRGLTLKQAVSSRKYFPTGNSGSSNNKEYLDIIKYVQETGSNITNGATGNSSEKVGFGKHKDFQIPEGAKKIPGTAFAYRLPNGKIWAPGQTFESGGERFGIEEGDINWKPKYIESSESGVAPIVPDQNSKGSMRPTDFSGSKTNDDHNKNKQSLISPVTGTLAGNGESNIYGASRSKGKRKHSGVDWQADNGSPVHDMTGGTVLYSGYNSGYEANIVILGNDGIIRRYAAHGSVINAKPGTITKQGDIIGTIGRRHLHYEEIPPEINGKKNPVYNEFMENPGKHVSTAHQNGTRDPIPYLGVVAGTKVEANKPFIDNKDSEKTNTATSYGAKPNNYDKLPEELRKEIDSLSPSVRNELYERMNKIDASGGNSIDMLSQAYAKSGQTEKSAEVVVENALNSPPGKIDTAIPEEGKSTENKGDTSLPKMAMGGEGQIRGGMALVAKTSVDLERPPTKQEIDKAWKSGKREFHFDASQEGAREARDYIKKLGGTATTYWQGGGSSEYGEKEINLSSKEGLKTVTQKAQEFKNSGYSAFQIDNMDRLTSVEEVVKVINAAGDIKVIPNGIKPSLLAATLKAHPELKDKINYAMIEHFTGFSKEEKQATKNLAASGVGIKSFEFAKGSEGVGSNPEDIKRVVEAHKQAGIESGLSIQKGGEAKPGEVGGGIQSTNEIQPPQPVQAGTVSAPTASVAPVINPVEKGPPNPNVQNKNPLPEAERNNSQPPANAVTPIAQAEPKKMAMGGEGQADNIALVDTASGQTKAMVNSDEVSTGNVRINQETGRFEVTPPHRINPNDMVEKKNNDTFESKRESSIESDRDTKESPIQNKKSEPTQVNPENHINVLTDLINSSANPFKSSSFHRAVAMSRFIEAGDPVRGGHFSYGSSNVIK